MKILKLSGKRLEYSWMKVSLILLLSFFVFGNLAFASDPADPNNPDSVYLECGGVTGGILNIKVRIVTDNIGDSNRIVAIGVPLEITNSNPAAKPVLDTTLGATFSGTAVEAWTSRSVYVVSNDRNPSIFPVKVGVSSLTFDYSLALRAGRYLFANVKIRLQDTTQRLSVQGIGDSDGMRLRHHVGVSSSRS